MKINENQLKWKKMHKKCMKIIENYWKLMKNEWKSMKINEN